jgi:hypothetical protein
MADDRHRRRVAVELNALHSTGALGDTLEGARIGAATLVYDLNGEPLFERLPLTYAGGAGHADVALHPAMGTILMSVSPDVPWDENEVLERARTSANDGLAGGLPADATERFVAYSYPKVAVQFLAGDTELTMLDVWSMRPVPPPRDRPPSEPPSHFERWSYLDEMPADHGAARQASHENRVAANEAVPGRDQLDTNLISRDQFGASPPGSTPGTGTGPGSGGGSTNPVPAAVDQRNLHYSTSAASHVTCYEKESQETAEWCVAASVLMLLDFYRYEYLQDRVATDLGLGTRVAPNALPNSQWDLVVSEIENLTSNAMTATKIVLDPTNPLATWQLFRAEIQANRPAISFTLGHSRTVAGYFDQSATGLSFRGLVVYDPYGPTGAGATFEDIMAPVYACAFTAELQLI